MNAFTYHDCRIRDRSARALSLHIEKGSDVGFGGLLLCSRLRFFADWAIYSLLFKIICWGWRREYSTENLGEVVSHDTWEIISWQLTLTSNLLRKKLCSTCLWSPQPLGYKHARKYLLLRENPSAPLRILARTLFDNTQIPPSTQSEITHERFPQSNWIGVRSRPHISCWSPRASRVFGSRRSVGL